MKEGSSLKWMDKKTETNTIRVLIVSFGCLSLLPSYSFRMVTERVQKKKKKKKKKRNAVDGRRWIKDRKETNTHKSKREGDEKEYKNKQDF
jgi:hypothetical protein